MKTGKRVDFSQSWSTFFAYFLCHSTSVMHLVLSYVVVAHYMVGWIKNQFETCALDKNRFCIVQGYVRRHTLHTQSFSEKKDPIFFSSQRKYIFTEKKTLNQVGHFFVCEYLKHNGYNWWKMSPYFSHCLWSRYPTKMIDHIKRRNYIHSNYRNKNLKSFMCARDRCVVVGST